LERDRVARDGSRNLGAGSLDQSKKVQYVEIAAILLLGLCFVFVALIVCVLWLLLRTMGGERPTQKATGIVRDVAWVSAGATRERRTRPYISPRYSHMAISDTADENDAVWGYRDVAFTAYPAGASHAVDSADRMVRNHADWSPAEPENPEELRRASESILLSKVLDRAANCLYCQTALTRGQTDDIPLPDRDSRSFDWRYEVAECPKCNWWCISYNEQAPLMIAWDFYKTMHAYAVMRSFDVFALDTPLELARRHLAHNQHKIARFDPFKFEDLMADCLRDCLGDHEIIKLGGRRDKGIDIKAVRSDGQLTLVSVKRHADYSKRESVKTIRDLHGVMLRDGVPRGMVITTARDFSDDAKDDVEVTSRRLEGYSMELLSLRDVVALLGLPLRAAAPWENLGITLRDPRPRWPATEDWIARDAVLAEDFALVL
jgi:Restriction endonuclease